VHRQRAASQEPRQRKLSVETQPPTSVEAWFLFNSSGELRVGDPDSSDTPPNHPAFWMHISQEYFLVTELSNNLLLNRFEMICPGPQLSVSRRSGLRRRIGCGARTEQVWGHGRRAS
jgi:hypothetical protein